MTVRALNICFLFQFMDSRKGKQEMVVFFESPTCPHLASFPSLFPCLSLSFSSAVFPVFLQGKACSSIKNIQGSLTFNFLFVVLFYPLPLCHTHSPPSPSSAVSFSLPFTLRCHFHPCQLIILDFFKYFFLPQTLWDSANCLIG